VHSPGRWFPSSTSRRRAKVLTRGGRPMSQWVEIVLGLNGGDGREGEGSQSVIAGRDIRGIVCGYGRRLASTPCIYILEGIQAPP
jgi:hypothetical protein